MRTFECRVHVLDGETELKNRDGGVKCKMLTTQMTYVCVQPGREYQCLLWEIHRILTKNLYFSKYLPFPCHMIDLFVRGFTMNC